MYNSEALFMRNNLCLYSSKIDSLCNEISIVHDITLKYNINRVYLFGDFVNCDRF